MSSSFGSSRKVYFDQGWSEGKEKPPIPPPLVMKTEDSSTALETERNLTRVAGDQSFNLSLIHNSSK